MSAPTSHRLHIGDTQHGALVVYVFDACDDGEEFPGQLEENHLVVARGQEERAWRMLVDGANSADATAESEACDPLDYVMRDALSKLGSRVAKRIGT